MRGAFAMALILTGSLLVRPRHVAAADKPSKQEVLKKEKSLEDVYRRIREEKSGVKAVAGKETSVLEEIEGIDKALAAGRRELAGLSASVLKTRGAIEAKRGRIKDLGEETARLKRLLMRRIGAVYRMRRGESVAWIFSSASLQDLGRRHRYLTLVMDSDAGLIRGYEEAVAALERDTLALASLGTELEAAEEEALARKAEAETLKRRKSAILAGLRVEKGKRVKAVKELEAAAADLAELLKGLRSEDAGEDASGPATGFPAMKGRLMMPVDGTVVSFYGKVTHPKYRTVTFNNGVLIEAPSGSSVKSVYDGRVVYAGWLRGYGQMAIVDNGGGYYTLFAHLSRISRDKGERVKAGSEVGVVGDTGPSSVPALYFEIRQKGVPRDPMAWFRER
jgi:septal ring factor EnvC (AmiA/AmiB activator)